MSNLPNDPNTPSQNVGFYATRTGGVELDKPFIASNASSALQTEIATYVCIGSGGDVAFYLQNGMPGFRKNMSPGDVLWGAITMIATSVTIQYPSGPVTVNTGNGADPTTMSWFGGQ